MANYSNFRALRALVKASLQSIAKSPSAIVFGVAFPLIFILVFGFLGGGHGSSIHVAAAPGTDSANPVYMALHQVPVLKWITENDTAALNKDLAEGDVAAIIDIKPNPAGTPAKYNIILHAASSQMDKLPQLQGILKQVIQQMDPEIEKRTDALAEIDVQVSEVREFKTIDFILPGQLGFSLLAGSVFGTAFVFFNMRQTLVLKRFFATPVRREIIVLSEGIARMIFQLITSVVIIGIGHYAFDYTLIHGALTFIELLLLSMLGIMVFMGFGFIISGLARSESTIPPLSNMITLPQFLLAGTFFSIDNFPKWLQPISKALPLTYLNDAMRRVAFDGVGFWEIKWDIVILLGWGVVAYFVAGRVFKWE
ncbi:ABC transporter permease [Chitinophagaceae bacterium MMS25-I14]